MEKFRTETFFALLRAGLWEQDIALQPYGDVDFDDIYKLAEGQSVIGLIAAGIEHVVDVKVKKLEARPFLVWVITQERVNADMNSFIVRLDSKLNESGVSSVLIKGQGVAQCYARPQWRALGDIDLLLDADNYEKAKGILLPLASKIDKESVGAKHQGMTLEGFEVELHGALKSLSRRMNTVIEEIQDGVNHSGDVRFWDNDGTAIPLPSANADAIFIFTHILKHFYKGGIGLRQICDWCRLLWTYRDSLDFPLLKRRLEAAGIMKEWKVFGSFAVDSLGMPADAMPFYEDRPSLHRKASRLQAFIMIVGNFGHNRDMSYYHKYPYVMRKAISASRRIGDGLSHMRIFPADSIKFMFSSLVDGAKSAVRGE